MPYYISEQQSDCDGWATVKKELDNTFTTLGCHKIKQDAIDQMIALSLSENLEPAGEVRAPAPKADQIFGSDTNPAGSAADKTGDITINEATEKGLQNKADEHNAKMAEDNRPNWTRVRIGALRSVWRRGAGAFSTSHRPNIGRQQWAMARVNAFLYLCSAGKPKNPKYITDNDLLHKDHPKYSDSKRATRAVVDLAPPDYMRANARRGLKLHEEGKSGDGLVAQTVADARKMAAGSVSEAKWRKIAPWIARHMTDLDAIEGDEITAGLVAHLLWGSSGTKRGATRTMNYAQGIIDQLNDTRSEKQMDYDDIDERELPDNYRPALSEDVPEGRACGNCAFYQEDNVDETGEKAYCLRWNDYVSGAYYCNAYRVYVKEDAGMDDEEASEMPDEEKHWVVAQSNDRSIVYSNLEVRASADGKTLTGYAAVFDSPSEPLPWTEFVRRGAFTKTINDGADVRLLIDHEGVPLARTKSGTLTLAEDDYGLRIAAVLDENNPDAARVISALKRGDLSQMSFAFQTVKDSWNSDRSTRELKEVRLHDVSVVTYPAYEQTLAEVRTRNNTVPTTVSSVIPRTLRQRQIEIMQKQAER